MKIDKMMVEGYAAVRDKSKDRHSSSEDEMGFNHSQILQASGQETDFLLSNIPLVNPTKNKNIKISPSDMS